MADILESIVIYLNDFFKSVGYGQNLLDSLSYISVKEGIRLADMLLALETLVFKLNNLKGNLKTLCDSLDTGSTSIAIKNQFSLKDYCVYDTEACGVREMPGQPQPSVEQEEGENFSGTLDVKEESEQTSHAAVPSIHPSVAQEPENTLAENMETSSMLLENSADRLSLDVSLQPAVKEELVSFAEYNPAAVCDKNTSVTQPGTEMLDEFQQPFVKNETACLPDYTSLAVPNDNTAVTQPPAHLPEADSYVMSEVGSAAAAATLSPHMMQIQASRSEVNRRITAFIEQKRLEVDENNQREFCSGLMPEHCETERCARTDAVFVPRAGSKSHVRVSRVVNTHGPQTRIPCNVPVKRESNMAIIKQEPGMVPYGIEERLVNMETHLKISCPQISKQDIFQRLKILEKRILFLESISPEYFQILKPINKKLRADRKYQQNLRESMSSNSLSQNLTVKEIDVRMNELRETLIKKQKTCQT